MMRPGGMGLRARLIALLLATLIPLVGLGIYWIVMEVRQEQAATERDAQKTAALVSVEAGRLVSGVQGMLAVLARLPAVQRPNRTEAARLFRDLLPNWPSLENIALVGADGVLLASAVSVPPIGPIHLEDRDWFQRTIRSGQPAVGGYHVGRVAGRPIAVLSQPVLDNERRVTAVVTAGLRLAAVSQEVAPTRIKAPVVWAVADAQDLVLLHSEPWGAIGRPLGPLTGMSRAEAVVPGTPWRAVVGVPEATFAAGLWRVLPVVGLPALLVLLGAGGVALWLARDIWRPLRALTATVRRVGAGEQGVLLPVEGEGELGEVAVALQDALGAVAAREADLARRNDELSALVEATRAIASSLRLEEILQAIVNQAASISGTPIVRLFLLDEEAQVLRYRVGRGLPLEAEESVVIPVGESFSGQVAATGRPVAVADCREDSRLRYPEHTTKYGLISYLGLPVRLSDRVLGVLVFSTQAPRNYSKEEIAYLSAFADQAAVAIENARLFSQEQARRGQLEAVRTVSEEIARELNLTRALEVITRRAADLVGAVSGAVYLWDEANQVLVPQAWHGYGDWMGGVRIKLGEGITGIVAQRRQGMIVNDYRTSSIASPIFRERTAITATVAEPLIYRDRLVGVITINNEGTGREFTEGDRQTLGLFAAQAGIAIENAQLYETAVRRGEETEALLRASSSVMAGLDLQTTLDRIVTEAAAIVGSTHVRVMLLDQQAGVLRVMAQMGKAPDDRALPLESLSGLTARTGEPVFSADAANDPRNPFAEWDRGEGIVTHISLPIKSRGRVLGVLTLNTVEPRQYTPAGLAYLSAFADQAAIAIENARLYSEIQRHAATLEVRVKERTAELEEALRAKVEFLGKMSHELRTPLNFVLGFSDLLHQGIGGPLTSKQTTYVDRIQTGGKRLLSLVNDVLDIAQVDAGKSRLRLEPVILGPLIQEVLGLVRVQATQKRLQVTTGLDPWMPFIVADRFKLGQILHNLVGNAVKFTPEDGSIKIVSRQVPAAGNGGPERGGQSPASSDSVELVVEDTGIGIRPENLETIFGAFYQVDGSETRAFGGAGLGLTLVHKLVDLHGGRVWAESAGPGRGSRFVVRLPRLEVPKAKRILLVEDEALIRIPMASALESAGFAVVDAATGADALAAMEAKDFDLLILDIVLPDLDGWQVLRQVRGAEDIRTLPVLVVTGLENVNAEQALALGADEFLTKPVSPRVLVDTAVRLLAQSGVGSAIAGPLERGSDELPGNAGKE